MLETDEMSATSYRHKIDALLTAGAANLGCSKYSTALGHLGNFFAILKFKIFRTFIQMQYYEWLIYTLIR